MLKVSRNGASPVRTGANLFCTSARDIFCTSGPEPQTTFSHWEIKGRFRKRVVLANVPSFRFSFRGNIRRNHPFGNHPFVNTNKGHWEIKGRFPKGWFWRTYPRSGFRSGGTSAKNLSTFSDLSEQLWRNLGDLTPLRAHRGRNFILQKGKDFFTICYPSFHGMFLRDSGTTTKYSKWHFPPEKSVDFPPRGLLTFAGNPVICAVKRRFAHPRRRENYRRIL